MGITEKAVLYSHFCFSWELSEIGAAKPDGARLLREAPAAFGRLCVETLSVNPSPLQNSPAAFGRLCVETICLRRTQGISSRPAAFGRLCVETNRLSIKTTFSAPAAFGRLCVETFRRPRLLNKDVAQPPSGGCVLKLDQKR